MLDIQYRRVSLGAGDDARHCQRAVRVAAGVGPGPGPEDSARARTRDTVPEVHPCDVRGPHAAGLAWVWLRARSDPSARRPEEAEALQAVPAHARRHAPD